MLQIKLLLPVLLLQLVSGIKYILQVEIGRTTCPKSSGDLQSCEFHDEPEMAKVGSEQHVLLPGFLVPSFPLGRYGQHHLSAFNKISCIMPLDWTRCCPCRTCLARQCSQREGGLPVCLSEDLRLWCAIGVHVPQSYEHMWL